MKCLDCKHLNRTQCPAAFINIDGCSDFIPKTNGDRIRAMSNEELAESIAHSYFSELAGLRWLGIMKNGNLECFFKKQNAIKSTIDWLNSPAESEVK